MLAHQLQNRGDAGQARAGFSRKGFGDRLIGAFQPIRTIKAQVPRDAIDDDFFVGGILHKSHPLDHRLGEVFGQLWIGANNLA